MKRIGIILICFCACQSIDEKMLTKAVWQYDSGYKIGQGDFIEFDDSNFCKIRDNVVYYNNQARAEVESVSNYQLDVISIQTREKGVYLNTRQFTK
jgi:hypothetical protein